VVKPPFEDVDAGTFVGFLPCHVEHQVDTHVLPKKGRQNDGRNKTADVHSRVLGKLEAAVEGEPTEYAVDGVIDLLSCETDMHPTWRSANIDEQANDVVKFYRDAVQSLKIDIADTDLRSHQKLNPVSQPVRPKANVRGRANYGHHQTIPPGVYHRIDFALLRHRQ
jgi:hypothetical protein